MGFHSGNDWTLDVSACTGLELLRCKNADVISVSGFTYTNNLRILDLSNNALTDLSELDGISTLETVIISGNSLLSLPDLSACSDLTWLNCAHNPMDPWILNVSGFSKLFLLDAKETNLDSVIGLGNLPLLE